MAGIEHGDDRRRSTSSIGDALTGQGFRVRAPKPKDEPSTPLVALVDDGTDEPPEAAPAVKPSTKKTKRDAAREAELATRAESRGWRLEADDGGSGFRLVWQRTGTLVAADWSTIDGFGLTLDEIETALS